MSTQQNRPNTTPGAGQPNKHASEQTPRTNTPPTPGGDRAQPGATTKAPQSDSGTKPSTTLPKHSDNNDPRKLEIEAGKPAREDASKKRS